ncbi:MAG: 3'-5' exonuclease [Thiomicrospira sp.]
MKPPYQIGCHLATEEQTAIIDAALRGESFKVSAFAGASKTTTLRGVAEQLTFKRILYLAFNKAIADEARRLFPGWVTCRTAHSLAYSYVIQPSPALRQKLSRGGSFLPYQDIEAYCAQSSEWRPFGRSRFQVNIALSETLNQYFNSADAQVGEQHIPEAVLLWSKARPAHEETAFRTQLIAYVSQLVALMFDEQHPCALTHDAYLKLFQLRQPVLPYDVILLDEAQDTNPVLQAILAYQRCQRILVGDRHQEIYAWRNAVNSLSHVALNEYPLTHSFRFGTHIAQLANRLLAHLNESRRVVGRGQDEPVNQGFSQRLPYAVMCRTNAKVFEVADYCLARGLSYTINGGLEQVSRLIRSAYGLYTNNRKIVPCAELSLFRSWQEFSEVAEELNKPEWKTLIKFVETHRDQTLHKIEQLGQYAQAPTAQTQVFISTVHKAKGLGFDQVVLASDFEWPELKSPQAREYLNLLYVAITRAKRVLLLPKSLRPALIPAQAQASCEAQANKLTAG